LEGRMRGQALLAASLHIVLLCAGARAETPKIVVGNNPSISAAPLYIAQDKGYYRDEGIEVQFESGTSGDMAILLATNRIQVTGGAISVGFFNSLSQSLPIQILMSRANSPFQHYIMVRPELKHVIKSPADLKGRTVASVSRGAINIYELAKVLGSVDLTLNDIQLKYVPFNQMGIALTTGAADAALMISPMQEAVEAKGLGVKWLNTADFITVQPVMISVWLINSDWLRDNPEPARKFVRATLRGVRDYCNAFHRGPNRAEVTAILAKYSDVKDPVLLDRIDWGATDVSGRVFIDSLMDIQAVYAREKLAPDPVPSQRLAPPPWLAEVANGLGPFQLANDDGRPGCR
jgi:NitT/TauT family transport system substrate-binding protein